MSKMSDQPSEHKQLKESRSPDTSNPGLQGSNLPLIFENQDEETVRIDDLPDYCANDYNT